MVNAVMLDQPLMERMVLGFREEEFGIENFELKSVDRQANVIVWLFIWDITEEYYWHEAYATFDGERVVYFQDQSPFKCGPGDQIKFTYTLSWNHRGGGDDDFVNLPSPPGCTLEFEWVAA